MIIRNATPDDAPALARISVDAWRWAYDGIVEASVLARMSYDAREEGWHKQFQLRKQNQSFQVAEVEGVIAGFIITGAHREASPRVDGELYAIYLRPDFVGKGIGSALFEAGRQSLIANGFREMMIWCFEENHRARAFYESKGGQLAARKLFRLVNREYPEVGYLFTLK